MDVVGVVAAVTLVAGVDALHGAPSLATFVGRDDRARRPRVDRLFATEQVGERFGPAVTGVLQSTLGNLPEFFIVVFALSAGEVVVAQTSIIGSIFANALLVLGLVIVAGCRASEDGVMRFSARLPKDNATLMLLASFLIVHPRHLGRDRRQGVAPRQGDLDRRRDRAARHLRRVARRLPPLATQRPEPPRRRRRAVSMARRARAARGSPASAPRSCRTGSSTR